LFPKNDLKQEGGEKEPLKGKEGEGRTRSATRHIYPLPFTLPLLPEAGSIDKRKTIPTGKGNVRNSPHLTLSISSLHLLLPPPSSVQKGKEGKIQIKKRGVKSGDDALPA